MRRRLELRGGELHLMQRRHVMAALALVAACKSEGVVVLLPVADAGADQRVYVGERVQLDGSQSHGSGQEAIASYAWAFVHVPSQSSAALSTPQPGIAEFTAGAEGIYVARLVVSVGEVQSRPDYVAVTAIGYLRVLWVVPGAPSPDGTANAQDVRVDAPIVIMMSAPVQPPTVRGGLLPDPNRPPPTVVLSEELSGSVVTGTVTLGEGNRVIVFEPELPLTAGMSYALLITQNVKDLFGQRLFADFRTTFTTATAADATRPRVVAIEPVDGAVDVGLSTPVVATFSEPVSFATLNSTSFVVSGPGGPMTGSYDLLSGGLRAYLAPGTLYATDADYTVELNAGLTDLSGNPLDGDGAGGDFVSLFHTTTTPDATPPVVTALYPGHGYKGVPLAAQVSVTFSEPVVVATSSALVLSDGTNTVAGAAAASAGNTVLTFTPAGLLQPSTDYTLTVAAAEVSDASGLLLDGDLDGAAGGDMQSRFTTAATRNFDGIFQLPAAITPGTALTVTLDDRDLDTTTGIDTAAVTAQSSAGEQEALLLTETAGSSGIFSVVVPTVFRVTAGTDNDGTFHVRAGDLLSFAYVDEASGAGVAQLVTQDVSVIGGVDATARIIEPTVEPGGIMTVEVRDNDSTANPTPGIDTVSVEVTSDTTGDTETVSVVETAQPGVFRSLVPTEFNPTAVAGDDVLQVTGGAVGTLTYSDPLRADGDNRGVSLNDTVVFAAGVDGVIDIVQPSLRAGMSLDIVVTDNDSTANRAAGPGNDTLSVTVTSAITGDSELVQLAEDTVSEGVFVFALPTAYSTTRVLNSGTLEVQGSETLTASYTDRRRANGDTSGVVITDTAGVDVGVDGTPSITPSSFRAGQAVTLTVNDADAVADSDGAPGTDTLAVTVTASGTADSESVLLAEDAGTAGLFRAVLNTAPAPSGVPDNGTLEVRGPGTITLSYQDDFRANGDTRGVVVTANSTVQAGVDAVIDIVQATFRAGVALNIVVDDADGAADVMPGPSNDSVLVTVTSATTGDDETVSLSETATAGRFAGTLPTAFAAAADGDGTLQVTGAETATARYTDGLRADGDTSGIVVQDSASVETGSNAVVNIVEVSIRAGQPLTLSVTDNDAVANVNAGAGNDSVQATVTASMSGDTETVTLVESTTVAGLFQAQIASAYNGTATPGNSTLEVVGGSTLTLSYSDMFRSDGDTRGVVVSDNASVRTGVDAVAIIVEPSFRAGQTLTLEVNDNDEVANSTPGPGNNTVTVVVSTGGTGDSQSVVLNEDAVTAGTFRGSLATAYNPVNTPSNNVLEVTGGLTATLSYTDMFRSNGNTGGVAVTDGALVKVGADALVEIVETSFRAGQPLNLRVTDNDEVANSTAGPGNNTVQVTVTSSLGGDSQTVTLNEDAASEGLFVGSLATIFSTTAVASDNLLQVQGGATVTLRYTDMFRANGDTRGVNVTDTATVRTGNNAVVNIVQATFVPGTSLNLEVTDNDEVANPNPGGSNDQVSVTVTNAASGDSETLNLNETSTAGAFAGVIPTAAAGSAVPGTSLDLQVTDNDEVANATAGGNNDQITVTVTNDSNGDSETLTLNETATPGAFSGTITTASAAGVTTG
ncbi:MAG: Ig-like domain-containing protein, partial [Deltaproteobacteria bacterium]|nr:Ig-like domain-containing protein [Deltaproteobacteria bacterium]